MKIAVAGGTGKTGRQVVEHLHSQGHQPVILARAHGVDLLENTGLDAALDGAEAIVDVSDFAAMNAKKAQAAFGAATTNLLAAAQRAGVRHHVALSIIGIDRATSGYYSGKLRQEELVKAGDVPWTILRAAQFHEFADQLLAQMPGPFAVVPKMQSQPIAVSEVAHTCAGWSPANPSRWPPNSPARAWSPSSTWSDKWSGGAAGAEQSSA